RKEGCDRFFVAHAAEGLALRESLGNGPSIFILNGIPPGAEDDCAAASLIPVLNSAEQVAAWRAAAGRMDKQLSAALQVDSGMARLGMAVAEVEALAAEPGALGGI